MYKQNTKLSIIKHYKQKQKKNIKKKNTNDITTQMYLLPTYLYVYTALFVHGCATNRQPNSVFLAQYPFLMSLLCSCTCTPYIYTFIHLYCIQTFVIWYIM